MFSGFQNWAIGKSLSYWDNAINDATLSNELIDHLRFGNNTSKIKTLNKLLKGSEDQIVVYAYTLYYINGYMDYIAAKLFGYLGGISEKLVTKHFRDTKFIYLLDWARPLWGDCRRIDTFMAQTNLKIKLNPYEVLKSIKYVQEVNIGRNTKTIESTRYSSSLLEKRFGLMDKRFELVKIKHSYINTQKRAIYWDKLYVKLIDLRSRNATYS